MARFALLLALTLGMALLAPKADAIQLQATIGQVTGGSCGYTNYPPPSYLVTGFSEAIYYNGGVCGACFKVQCFGNPQCIPGRAVNVMVTSICQSTNTTDVCNTGNKALNLDPRAWDLIVKTRALGSVPVSVFSAPCPAMAGGVQFNVSVATQYYMQVLIQNVGGMGRLAAVYATTNGIQYYPMYRNYGSVWAIERVNLLGKAVSFKLVDMLGRPLLVKNALPANWGMGHFNSIYNFKAK